MKVQMKQKRYAMSV